MRVFLAYTISRTRRGDRILYSPMIFRAFWRYSSEALSFSKSLKKVRAWIHRSARSEAPPTPPFYFIVVYFVQISSTLSACLFWM